ncbi:amidohydrolase family protein, partial [Acidobacteria bacterium AH-259-D05]|nr:amidohydrolase family protein [Acidobacteria bacterium AH-259-D05]
MTKVGTLFVFPLALVLFPLVGQAQQIHPDLVVYPDLIVHNAKIVAMDDYDINSNVGSTSEAMAVRGTQVWKLGRNDEILRYAGPETIRVDAKRRTIIPGIINVHTHIHDGAMNKWIDANPTTTAVKVFRVPGKDRAEIRKNVEVLMKERMGNIKPGQWTFFYLPRPPFGTGGGPGYDFLRMEDMTAQEIDKLTGLEKPVILASHPAYIINTAGMNYLEKMYGGKTEDYPEGWSEVGFADLGVEYRREVVVDGYFADKTDQLKEILHQGLLEAATAGITTFSSHIMGIQNLDAYMRLFRENRLPIRFAFTHYTGFTMNRDGEGFYRRFGDLFQLGNEYMWLQAIGLGMIDHGPPLFCSSIVNKEALKAEGKKEDYYEWCRYSHEAKNYQAIVTALVNGSRVVAGHNFGDLSSDYLMDAIEEAIEKSPEITLDYIRSLRLSMDHGGLYPRPDQLPRIKKLGMILSMGAGSMSRSLPWIQKWGFERYQGWVVPTKRALDAGIKVAWEGEGGVNNGLFALMTPFITRKNRQGVIIAPDQAVDRNTVLKMATAWGSEFLLKEDELGSLEPGKFADFLVLNQDYFTVPLGQLDRTYPLMTVMGGKIRYLREEFAKELGMAPV